MIENRDCYICGKYVKVHSPETGGQGVDKNGTYHLGCLPDDGLCQECGQRKPENQEVQI